MLPAGHAVGDQFAVGGEYGHAAGGKHVGEEVQEGVPLGGAQVGEQGAAEDEVVAAGEHAGGRIWPGDHGGGHEGGGAEAYAVLEEIAGGELGVGEGCGQGSQHAAVSAGEVQEGCDRGIAGGVQGSAGRGAVPTGPRRNNGPCPRGAFFRGRGTTVDTPVTSGSAAGGSSGMAALLIMPTVVGDPPGIVNPSAAVQGSVVRGRGQIVRLGGSQREFGFGLPTMPVRTSMGEMPAFTAVCRSEARSPIIHPPFMVRPRSLAARCRSSGLGLHSAVSRTRGWQAFFPAAWAAMIRSGSASGPASACNSWHMRSCTACIWVAVTYPSPTHAWLVTTTTA